MMLATGIELFQNRGTPMLDGLRSIIKGQTHRSPAVSPASFSTSAVSIQPNPLLVVKAGLASHGVFTGEYWRQITPEQRVAFVECYLACYREHLGARPQKFSQPTGTYAENISRWYGINGDDMNSKLADVPIADALYKLADRPATTSVAPSRIN